MNELEQIQTILSNHGYEYLKTIGAGSFSQVFLCKSLKYNYLFAVKRVNNSKVIDSEINTLIYLNHPHIIRLYEIFNEDEYQYLVMEYCKNDTIKEKGKLDSEQFIYYSKQILEAISYCHSLKIAHRDIKPENIFLDHYDRIKLADFGFAKQFDNGAISNERCGSIMFCAPEIVKDQSSFNPFQADIYALGITFFYMATGKLPFSNSSADHLKRSIIFNQIDFSKYKVKSEIKSMILKMVSKNPISRPTINSLLRMPLYNHPQKMVSFLVKSSKSHGKLPLNNHWIRKSMSYTYDVPIDGEAQEINRYKSFIMAPSVISSSTHQTFSSDCH